jgi:hypothetical protein
MIEVYGHSFNGVIAWAKKKCQNIQQRGFASGHPPDY